MRHFEEFGGASRARTDDLIVANDALSQLSYSPTPRWVALSTSGSHNFSSRPPFLAYPCDENHFTMFTSFAKLHFYMRGFSILTNRKRAIVALIHSIVFLLIAFRQMIAATPAAGVWLPSSVSTGTWVLCGIFTIVSAILLWLFAISRGWIERLYFGMCTVSASSGLLRTAFGDQAFHAGLYIRVVMLISAVLVGLLIVRLHSPAPPLPDSPESAS
jgi:hypothetical protein